MELLSSRYHCFHLLPEFLVALLERHNLIAPQPLQALREALLIRPDAAADVIAAPFLHQQLHQFFYHLITGALLRSIRRR